MYALHIYKFIYCMKSYICLLLPAQLTIYADTNKQTSDVQHPPHISHPHFVHVKHAINITHSQTGNIGIIKVVIRNKRREQETASLKFLILLNWNVISIFPIAIHSQIYRKYIWFGSKRIICFLSLCMFVSHAKIEKKTTRARHTNHPYRMRRKW